MHGPEVVGAGRAAAAGETGGVGRAGAASSGYDGVGAQAVGEHGRLGRVGEPQRKPHTRLDCVRTHGAPAAPRRAIQLSPCSCERGHRVRVVARWRTEIGSTEARTKSVLLAMVHASRTCGEKDSVRHCSYATPSAAAAIVVAIAIAIAISTAPARPSGWRAPMVRSSATRGIRFRGQTGTSARPLRTFSARTTAGGAVSTGPNFKPKLGGKTCLCHQHGRDDEGNMAASHSSPWPRRSSGAARKAHAAPQKARADGGTGQLEEREKEKERDAAMHTPRRTRRGAHTRRAYETRTFYGMCLSSTKKKKRLT